MIGGLLAVTIMSTADVAVAKVAFDDHTAGIYGAASLAGRAILYLPAAIVMVLLPKVAARAAIHRDSSDILTASLLVTASFCLAVTAIYAVFPEQVVMIAFGSDYADAGPLL